MLNEALVPSRTRPATMPRSSWMSSRPRSSSCMARPAWARSSSPPLVAYVHLPHPHADGRLARPDLPRRPREAAVPGHRLERVEMRELHVHDDKKYLIIMIMTIDFTDDRIGRMLGRVDMNHFVAEIIARERLDSARAYAA